MTTGIVSVDSSTSKLQVGGADSFSFNSSGLITGLNRVPVRQTVLSGPVDSSGFPSFGGSTGSTTVTASGTLIATAAAGTNVDYVGTIVNPSWTGLSTNGTMYLYLDITSAGATTTGSTTLAPVYQFGGTYSTTNNQNTYNIQEATMKAGNGSTASQVYRVFVGEVTVAGGVTTVITWYALMGIYDSGFTATLPGAATKTSKNHNLGVKPGFWNVIFECTTTESGYAVGDQVDKGMIAVNQSGGILQPFCGAANSLSAYFISGGAAAFVLLVTTTGVAANFTAANWKYKLIAQRGW